jgi:hypothetical protein
MAREWMTRNAPMWTTTTRVSSLSPTQKWVHRATLLFSLIPRRYVDDPEMFALYETLFQKYLDHLPNHNVYSVVGASMLLIPPQTQADSEWRFSLDKYRQLCKEWDSTNSDRQNPLLPHLREHTSQFQILVYVRKLSGAHA